MDADVDVRQAAFGVLCELDEGRDAVLAFCRRSDLKVADVIRALEDFAYGPPVDWCMYRAPERPTTTNWHLSQTQPDWRQRVARRLAGLRTDRLVSYCEEVCRARYGVGVRGLFVHGGYLYGLGRPPADLDVMVFLTAGSVVENQVRLTDAPLTELIGDGSRWPEAVELGVIGGEAISSSRRNSAVSRALDLSATTGIYVRGLPAHSGRIPRAAIVRVGMELMASAAKLALEPGTNSRERAATRLREVLLVLRELRTAGGMLPGFDRELQALDSVLWDGTVEERLAVYDRFAAVIGAELARHGRRLVESAVDVLRAWRPSRR